MTSYVSGPNTFDHIRWAAQTCQPESDGVPGLNAADPQYASAIQDASPHLAPLTASALEFDDLRCATLDIIESAFNSVASHGIDPDTASRLLVALNPRLFVSWDSAIRDSYFPDNEPDGATYGQFLSVMRMAALSIATDARVNHGIEDPAGYLSHELESQPGRTLAGFIDQYNWLTLTRAASQTAGVAD